MIWLAIAVVVVLALTVVALALVGGARHTGPHLAPPFPPILRSAPRDTDWFRHEGDATR